MKTFLTEQDQIHEEWYINARSQTLDTLPKFLYDILDNYSHDQKTIVHAITAGAMATISAMNNHPEGDIGVSQSHAILGMFIRKWACIEGPAKITSWSALLNPRNELQMMQIPKEVAVYLTSMATQALAQNKFENESHKKHLETISKGDIPWGFKVI